MGTGPTVEAVSAGRAYGYGPDDWVALAVSAMAEAVKGMRDDRALSADEAIGLVTGLQALGELFPEVVSDLSRGLSPALRDIERPDGFATAQSISAGSALSGAAAGLSRGGGWLDYAHEALIGFRSEHPPLPKPALRLPPLARKPRVAGSATIPDQAAC